MKVGAAVLAAVLAAPLPAQGQASRPPDPVLALSTPVEQSLEAGAAHTFSLSLDAGAFVSLSAEQQGIDVRIKVVGPAGATLIDESLVDHRFGREPAFLVAAEGGPHRITVSAVSSSAGRYRLSAEARPAPSEHDRERLQAQAELREARGLEREQKAESYRAAVARYEAALARWQATGDDDLALSTQIEIGRLLHTIGDQAPAVAALSRGLAVAEAQSHRPWQARAHHLLGDVAFTGGDLDEARRRYQASLELVKELGDRAGLADVISDLGVALFNLGQTRKGIEMVQEGLALWREVGDERGEVSTLANLGACHLRLSEMQEALDVLNETLRIRRKQGSKRGEATALANIATAYGRLGERELALESFAKALSLFRGVGERRHAAVVLTSMGHLNRELGHLEKASELLEEALAITRELGEPSREASVLRFRARLRLVRGDLEGSAADAETAARVFGGTGDRWSRAESLRAVLRARTRQRRAEEARSAGQEARELHRALGDREGEAGALSELAQLALQVQDLALARRQAEEALEKVEFLRRSVRSVALRAAYTATLQEYYELYVEILMQLHRQQPGAGFAAQAFRAAEQARGRGLLELLVESSAALQEGVSPALVEEERQLQEQLSFKLDQQVRLLGGSPKPGQKEALEDEIDSLTAEYEEVRSRMRAASPKYAALSQPEPRSLAEIQQQVLNDEGTLLLEYALGSPRSYLWAVTARELATYELPGRAEVEGPARRAYELLSRREPDAAEQRERDELLARLGRMLLGPVERLRAARRVVVVTDGALQYLPFAVLRDPSAGGAPLIAGHEVVGAPSASLLALLRDEVGTRPAAPKAVAVLADPVFDARDSRVQPAGRPPDDSAGDRALQRATRDAGLEGGLARLPFTRREARAILDLASPRRRREALDFEASRATATDQELASYRYLHFATHGFLNSARPELSGLVLSLVDRRGRPQKGFLAAPDVFDLRLGADLVVLSGCRTALGREVRGEGLVGLTRAFMYAGAPRVVASLWKVDDAATAELMTHFYQGLLRRGLRPAAALREAQLAMRRSRRFSAPYYWAAFQLQGEWN
jgi:CHAT domain-containing protein/tetratricopeptide (TPR) repeat protein